MFDHWDLRDGILHADVEVGIPLTGRTGLGESALLKLLADMRWRQLAHLCGVDSRDLVDENGDRLYATIYFVELHVPDGRALASIGENDQLTIISTLVSDEGSFIDGFHFLYPMSWREDRKVPLPDGEAAIGLGVPYVRVSNAFVKMVQGASWLKKAVPATDGMRNVPRGSGGQDTYQQVVVVSGGDRVWRRPPETYDAITEGKVTFEYVPDPDRDLNGLGLLYYANYPVILDLAERKLLRQLPAVALSDELLDLRTVFRRQSAYVSNIVPPDTIEVSLEGWIENPVRARTPDPGAQPVRLFINYEMRRRSDGRKMMVSTAEKLIHGPTVDDAGLLPALKQLAKERRPAAAVSGQPS